MLIDCHTHAYSKKGIQSLLLSMKKNGIDKSIIMYWPNICGTTSYVFEEVLRDITHHKNLLLAGSIRVTDSRNFDAQLKESEKALAKRQIVGIKNAKKLFKIK